MKQIKLILTICLWMVIVLLLCTSCGDSDDDDDSESAPATDDDDDDNTQDGDDDNDDSVVDVICDYIEMTAPPAPPNPVNGATTPDELNRYRLFRYRQDTGDLPPRSVNSIIVFLPGWGAGAADFMFAAPDIVKSANGDIEIWVPDRRSEMMEDQWGMDLAEYYKDPQIAYDYYFNNLPVEGKTFEGFLDPYSAETDMMSEWGIDLELQTILELIEIVPEDKRAENVILGGHSMGVRTARMFTSYEFPDGMFGYEYLAGLILYDGKETYEPLSEEEYLLALDRIRKGEEKRFKSQFHNLADVSTYYLIQYLAMAASEGFGEGDPRFGPDGHIGSWYYFGLLGLLLTRFQNIEMTNEAFFGLALDDESSPLLWAFSGQMGRLTGGKLNRDALGTFPDDKNASYSWLNYDEFFPEELVDIQNMLKLLYAGPSDFTDGYYSSRLLLEHMIAVDIDTTGTWMDNYFHYYPSLIDIPVLGVRSGYMAGTNVFEEFRDKLAPIRGTNESRTDYGFDIIDVFTWSHMEVLIVQADRNPIYPGVVDWAKQWTHGEVQIPHFGTLISSYEAKGTYK